MVLIVSRARLYTINVYDFIQRFFYKHYCDFFFKHKSYRGREGTKKSFDSHMRPASRRGRATLNYSITMKQQFKYLNREHTRYKIAPHRLYQISAHARVTVGISGQSFVHSFRMMYQFGNQTKRRYRSREWCYRSAIITAVKTINLTDVSTCRSDGERGRGANGLFLNVEPLYGDSCLRSPGAIVAEDASYKR